MPPLLRLPPRPPRWPRGGVRWLLFLRATLAAAGPCTGTCAGALAEPVDLTFAIASATVLRGLAIGDRGVHGQVAARYADDSGWRLALAAAALHSSTGSPRWDLQSHWRAGYARRFGAEGSVQLAFARYDYPHAARLRRYAQDELAATLAYRDNAYASVSVLRRLHAPAGDARHRVAYDLVAQTALPFALTASAAIGFVQVRGGSRSDYLYGHLGLGARHGATQAQLLYVATDAARRFGPIAASRWVASLQWDF